MPSLRAVVFACGLLHCLLYLICLITLAALYGHGAVQVDRLLIVPLTMLPPIHMAICIEMAFSARTGNAFGLLAWLGWFAVWLPAMTVGLCWLMVGWCRAGDTLSITLLVLAALLLLLLWPPYVLVAVHYNRVRRDDLEKDGAKKKPAA